MTKKTKLDSEFAALFQDAKPVVHDKYVPTRQDKQKLKQKQRVDKPNTNKRQQAASIALSDEFEAYWPDNKPISYVRENNFEEKDLVKKLKLGHFPPDIEIDLHGQTGKQAKEELLAVIHEAKTRHYPCINIIHGHGNGVLKHKVPNWLVQHQDVVGFTQAPRAYGGKAALLVLVDVGFDEHKLV